MTIEERAKEYANQREGTLNPSTLCCMADAYEDGYKDAIKKVCTILEKHMSEGYISPPTEYIKATLEAFRKDMEE